MADILESIPALSMKERYTFAMAPANTRDSNAVAALLHFAVVFSKGLPVILHVHVPKKVPTSGDTLRTLEAAHQVRACRMAMLLIFLFLAIEHIIRKLDA